MADESLSFDEQILEAAKAIALATSALIKWATATQRELVTQGRVCAEKCYLLGLLHYYNPKCFATRTPLR